MNRHAIKWAILGATLIALMGPTGGFPSRPTFQSVKVTGTLNTSGQITGTGGVNISGGATIPGLTTSSVWINGTGSQLQIGSPVWPWVSTEVGADIGFGGAIFSDAAGNLLLTSNIYHLSSTVWSRKNTGAGAVYYEGIDGSHSWYSTSSAPGGSAATMNTTMNLSAGGVLSVNGVAVPKVSYALCAAGGGFIGQHGNVASCTHSSTGFYTATFTSNYLVAPTCTVSPSNPGQYASTSMSTVSTAQFNTWVPPTTAQDEAFAFSCFGT